MTASKPPVKPAIEDAVLVRIRSAVSTLEDQRRAGVVDLVEAIDGGRMTVDFDAAKALGHPLVVVEAPSAEPPRAKPPWFDALSPREREVCAGLREGKSNQDLARALFISVATVKDHVHNILGKRSYADEVKSPQRLPISDESRERRAAWSFRDRRRPILRSPRMNA